MKTTKLLTIIPAALSLSLAGAIADTACSPAIGFNKVTMKGGSDSIIALPFHQKPVFTGALSGVPSTVAITVDGEADTGSEISFTGGDLSGLAAAETLYLRFTSGSKDGFWYQVHETDSSSVTVRLNGDVLTGVTTGDTATIIPHSTLDSAFPNGAAIHATTNPIAVNGTEILFPNNVTMGINKGVTSSYYFFNGAWRLRGGAFDVDEGATKISPSTYFIVRHKDGSDDTEICVDGRVPSDRHVIQIDQDVEGNDNYISIDRPVPTFLEDFGQDLIASGAFKETTNPIAVNGDELLIFDNTVASINRGIDRSYYYFNGGWRLRGGSFSVDVGVESVDNEEHRLNPGEGVILRSKAGAAASLFLVNDPSY